MTGGPVELDVIQPAPVAVTGHRTVSHPRGRVTTTSSNPAVRAASSTPDRSDECSMAPKAMLSNALNG